ncbi:cytochrome P450 4V2 [Trichonephila clavata]|uniref:Cytochrome P450 4V2 n=1 Tax=Trichonephila clavata TaxID=2740835 RepID=A0A8X6LMM1_TRICU|nr:cytochrome P450 4V2 [Trichonephila clavata]
MEKRATSTLEEEFRRLSLNCLVTVEEDMTNFISDDFDNLNGYHQLFFREGISCVWFFYPLVTVFKAESVEVILNNNEEVKKAWFYEVLKPWLGSSVLISCDKKWRDMRKLLTPIFHFHVLNKFLAIMNKHSRNLGDLFDTFVQQECVDIYSSMPRHSFDTIFECILDKEINTLNHPTGSYLKAVEEVKFLAFERIHNPWFWNDFLFRLSSIGRKYSKCVQVLHNFTNKVISQKRKLKLSSEKEKQPATEELGLIYSETNRKKISFLDLLLDEHLKHGSLSEEAIREQLDTLLFAGHDTTSVSLSFCMWMVGLHPWVQDKIHEEMDAIFDNDDRDATLEDLRKMQYLECVIKETLRLYPPVTQVGRRVRSDLHFRQYTIPKGSECLVNIYVLHRDPEVFPDPEKFDPERFTPENSAGRHPFAFVPFSAGPRNCLGQRFALMKLKIVLSSVFRRYKFRSLNSRDKVNIISDFVLRPADGLQIQIRKRHQNFNFDSVYYYP